MSAYDAPLRSFGQESRDAEAQAGPATVITPEQAAAARRWLTRCCTTHGLGADVLDHLVDMVGVRA